MKKVLHLIMLLVFIFCGALSASANPNGGVPRYYTFPPNMSPVETLQYFHHKITDRDFGMAWDVLTEDYKNFFKSYGSFEKGYATMLTSRPGSLRVIEQTGDTAKIAYVIHARDWLDETRIAEQAFECTAVLKMTEGGWLLDSGSGKLIRREELDSHRSAAAVLKSYHECITHKEMRTAWNLLGSGYKKSFGDFPAFCNGFTTTVSSAVSNIVPVADGPNMTALEYTLTAKDSTKETNVVQVFKGMAEMEVVPGQGWRIMSASNKLVDRYFPPKW